MFWSLDSNPKRNTKASAEHFRWCSIGQTFPGSIIEGQDNVRKVCGRDAGKVRVFREIVPQQPIGILVGPAFPGRIGSREVHT